MDEVQAYNSWPAQVVLKSTYISKSSWIPGDDGEGAKATAKTHVCLGAKET